MDSQSTSRRESDRSSIVEVIQDAASYGMLCVPIALIENENLGTSRQILNGSRANQSRDNIDIELLKTCFPEHMAKIMKTPPKSYSVDPKYLLPSTPVSDSSSPLEEESDFSISACEMQGVVSPGPVASTPRRSDRRLSDKPSLAVVRRLNFDAAEESDDGANTSQVAGPSTARICSRAYATPVQSASSSGSPRRRSDVSMSPAKRLSAACKTCPLAGAGQTTPVRRRSCGTVDPNTSFQNEGMAPLGTSSPAKMDYAGTPKHFSPRQYPQNCNFIRVVSDSLNDSMYLPDYSDSSGCGYSKFEVRPESLTYPRKTAYDLAPIWRELARPKRKKVVTNRIVTYLPEIDDTCSDSSFERLRYPRYRKKLRFNDFDVPNPELLENVSMPSASCIDAIDAANELEDQYLSDVSEPSMLYDVEEFDDEGEENPCRNRSTNRGSR